MTYTQTGTRGKGTLDFSQSKEQTSHNLNIAGGPCRNIPSFYAAKNARSITRARRPGCRLFAEAPLPLDAGGLVPLDGTAAAVGRRGAGVARVAGGVLTRVIEPLTVPLAATIEKMGD